MTALLNCCLLHSSTDRLNRRPLVSWAGLDASFCVLAHAAALDRQADLHLSEGRAILAERLSRLALEVRCKAAGVAS